MAHLELCTNNDGTLRGIVLCYNESGRKEAISVSFDTSGKCNFIRHDGPQQATTVVVNSNRTIKEVCVNDQVLRKTSDGNYVISNGTIKASAGRAIWGERHGARAIWGERYALRAIWGERSVLPTKADKTYKSQWGNQTNLSNVAATAETDATLMQD